MNSEILKNASNKMKTTISVLKKDLASLKAGRANPSMLDRIEVDYYGTMTPINQLSNVSVPEPRILLIQPWDKQALKAIEKAILISDLGINPSNDGSCIRLVIPELTEETRKNLVKNVKKIGEESKIAIRSVRREANDKVKDLKKKNEMSEDDIKRVEDEIQNETDKFINEIDKIIENKEKEVMSI